MTVWAFAKIDDSDARKAVYKSITIDGKSRFGWSSKDSDDLRKKWNGKQAFLLSIKPGDWIVHVNMPEWGKCVAVQVIGVYDFDNGINCDWGIDFRHSIPIDINTIVEFNRNSIEVLPTVNLNPRQRYQRIYAVEDFLKSIENIKNNTIKDKKNEDDTKEIFCLKEKSNDILENLTKLIHNTHKGKNLERYLAKVFRQIPNIVDVNENGFGWKTDNGADLVLTTSIAISNIQFENKIVVQIKSYDGDHYDLSAVEQIKTAIKKYEASAGIIITTAKRTKQLEEEIEKVSKEIDSQIELIAGEEVAKFVIKYDKEQNLVFDLNY
jgi:restriction endonuclease Mrr